MLGVTFVAFVHSLDRNNTLIFIFEVYVREPLLVFAEDDCYISFGDSPKIDVAIISDTKAKLFHDRNASDAGNSAEYLSVKIFAKNVLPILGLEVGNGAASIAIAIQMHIAKVDFRRKSFVGELLEGGTAIQV